MKIAGPDASRTIVRLTWCSTQFTNSLQTSLIISVFMVRQLYFSNRLGSTEEAVQVFLIIVQYYQISRNADISYFLTITSYSTIHDMNLGTIKTERNTI